MNAKDAAHALNEYADLQDMVNASGGTFPVSLNGAHSSASLRYMARALSAEATPSSRWSANGEPDPHGTYYACERAKLAHGDMTDDELANAVFLDPNIGHLMAAKDRIRWLSRKLAATPPSPAGTPKASWDTKALEVAARFTQDTEPQRRAELQCAVLEAMQWASPAESAEGDVTPLSDVALLRALCEDVTDMHPTVREQLRSLAKRIESGSAIGATRCRKCGEKAEVTMHSATAAAPSQVSPFVASEKLLDDACWIAHGTTCQHNEGAREDMRKVLALVAQPQPGRVEGHA